MASTRVRIAVLILMVALFGGALPVRAEPSYSDYALQRVWERYDKPVSDRITQRSWTWGPKIIVDTGLSEPYAEAPGGRRLVQYFDKSRMEITNPAGDPTSQWFVTNGLLATELVTGRRQMGDASFEERDPADIPVAGDPDDTSGPLYSTFTDLLGVPPAGVGSTITQTLDRAGTTGNQPDLARYGVTAAHLVPDTQHVIAGPFWDFLNASGPVYETDTSQTVTARLYDPTFFVTGFPVTEPYWARVKVAGQVQDVLVQVYERRVLTYTPANPAGFQVEMGNVGLHYFQWRYSKNWRYAEAAAQPGEVLTQQDFADPTGGWPIDMTETASVGYANGGYRIGLLAGQQFAWVATGPGLTNVQIEADVTKLAGPDGDRSGLICRMVDDGSYYEAVIGSDGRYAIRQRQAGQAIALHAPVNPSPAIRPAGQMNRLRFDCVGSTLSLSVNGQQLIEVQDADYGAGRVGIRAGSSSEQPGTEILFDNFVVYKQ